MQDIDDSAAIVAKKDSKLVRVDCNVCPSIVVLHVGRRRVERDEDGRGVMYDVVDEREWQVMEDKISVLFNIVIKFCECNGDECWCGHCGSGRKRAM